MKKYLMIGFAALAFASCSKNDFETYSPEDIVKAEYDAKFIAEFGQPAKNQTWGFGSGTRAFTRSGNMNGKTPVAQTSTGINANANEWADPTKEFGGWQVPDPLTDRQRLRVYRYFQTHPNLGYQDPEWSNFFVQQCYTGGDDQYGVSTEDVTAANTSHFTSDNMNHLTVGKNHQHINNFNAGKYGVEAGSGYGTEGAGGVGVLDNGHTVNEFDTYHHSDQIMLMVNIDDTSCFGYQESGASVQRDDKMALVAASTIDEWAKSAEAKALGIDLGDPVVDKWGRSFLGFDHALLNIEEAYAENTLTYQNQYSVQCNWGWDGEKVVPLKELSKDQWGNLNYGAFLPEYGNVLDKDGNPVRYFNTNANFYISFDQVDLTGEYNLNGNTEMTEVSEELLNSVLIFKDAKIVRTAEEGMVQNNKDHVLNLALIKKMVDDGYNPINNAANNAKWIKAGDSDGYYTDWIVTLTEAQRITTEKVNYEGRIMAEDLTVADKSDWDFNDVVFDWAIKGGKAYIKLLAAGGTLPLTIGGELINGEVVGGVEVHSSDKGLGKYMVNTGVNQGPAYKEFVLEGEHNTYADGDANAIKLHVKKNVNGVQTWVEIKAEQGKPAGKFNSPVGTAWCEEYANIKRVYTNFAAWVANASVTWAVNPVAKYVDYKDVEENKKEAPLTD